MADNFNYDSDEQIHRHSRNSKRGPSNLTSQDTAKDQMTTLTRDELLVLFTLYLNAKINTPNVSVDDSATMGDIDVVKTVKDLVNKNILQENNNRVVISQSYFFKINDLFRKMCMQSYIDQEFFIEVASVKTLCNFTEGFSKDSPVKVKIGASKFKRISPRIRIMRLIMETEPEEALDILRLCKNVNEDIIPSFLFNDDDEYEGWIEKMRDFAITWCRNKNKHPMEWADGIPAEMIKSIFSAYNIYKGWGKKFTYIPECYHGVLFCIMLSEDCSISLNNDSWHGRLKEIRKTFGLTEKRTIAEDTAILNEIVEKKNILIKTDNNVKFKRNNERQWKGFEALVFIEFAMTCLRKNEDYQTFLSMASTTFVDRYCLFWERMSNGGFLYIPDELEDIFIQKLGFLALEHVCFAELEYDEFEEREKELMENVSETLGLPFDALNLDEKILANLLKFSKKANKWIEEQKIAGSRTNLSIFGSFLIDDSIVAGKNYRQYFAGMYKNIDILITILFADGYRIPLQYSWKGKLCFIQDVFDIQKRTSVDESNIPNIVQQNEMLTISDNLIHFKSERLRHRFMSFFVLNFLGTRVHYEYYIRLSSVDSLLEYARHWDYKRKKTERCLFIPHGMEYRLIEKLGIQAIKHVMVEERYGSRGQEIYPHYRHLVATNINVPEEILAWDYDARCRYVKWLMKESFTMHRARAMLVGCAGAGKTTLLKRLHKQSLEELKQTESTIGLDVHTNIFEVDPKAKCLKEVVMNTINEKQKLLSVVDFGGQCAYYACHQVYLSRRAFYLLVIDITKAFKDKVDQRLCDQRGTMFEDWTYGDYVVFWLKSIHTYCDDETSSASVTVVATHCERLTCDEKKSFYDNLLDLLPPQSNLKKHLSRDRCFFVGFLQSKTEGFDEIKELENNIFSIAEQDQWCKTIPKTWLLCDITISNIRRKMAKMIPLRDLLHEFASDRIYINGYVEDTLRFFHEIGTILFFNEQSLQNMVIINVQWFVDCFKHIISDVNHVRDIAENDVHWREFYDTGRLQNSLLCKIWETKKLNMCRTVRYELPYSFIPPVFVEEHVNKMDLLLYMQRLGLLAIGTDTHYIPCVNKKTFGSSEKKILQNVEKKTSVLVFQFHFLPYFFYFRLIVACLVNTNGTWEILQDNGPCLFKNIACFMSQQHSIALAVTRSTIQLQVFKLDSRQINKDVTLEIRKVVESTLADVTRTYHKKVLYAVGYQCSHQSVFEEYDECFIGEKEIYGKNEIVCPRHGFMNHHTINEKDLLQYWIEGIEKTSKDAAEHQEKSLESFEICSEKMCYETFEKLTDIGRKSLQLYFDTVFPPQDLPEILQKNKFDIEKGQYRFNGDQIKILFPENGNIPSSNKFDVTIMYKLLRNYGHDYSQDLQTSSKSWGLKPDIDQTKNVADIERIRNYRNTVAHKTEETRSMDEDTFELSWKDLSLAIKRLSDRKLSDDVEELETAHQSKRRKRNT